NRIRPWTVNAFLMAGAIAAFALPIYAVFGKEAFSYLNYHTQRPIQVESVYANIILLLNVFVDLSPKIVHGFGSFNLESKLTNILSTASPFISLSGLAVIFAIFLKRQSSGSTNQRDLTLFICAAFFFFLVSSKVLSPQYLIWL